MQTQANALDSKLEDFWKESLGMTFVKWIEDTMDGQSK
jgi:hypothetical protein